MYTPEHNYIQYEPFSSAFFRDHKEEQYVIQRAIQAQNFSHLRDKIANSPKHGSILQQRIEKVQETVESEAKTRKKNPLQKQEEPKERINRKRMQQVGRLAEHRKLSVLLTFVPQALTERCSMKIHSPMWIDWETLIQEATFFHSTYQKTLSTASMNHNQEPDRRSSQDRRRLPSFKTIKKSHKGDAFKGSINSKRDRGVSKETSAFSQVFHWHQQEILHRHSFNENPRLHTLMSRLCESEELSKYQLRRSAR